MKLLITNDDGWHAPGIRSLHERASRSKLFSDLYLVAPSAECSATSHSITINSPLRVDGSHGHHMYSVDGKPADCVKLALGHIMPELPDLVLSGINRGPNLGVDTLYSGTVAAAMEAAMAGLPAIAVSSVAHQGGEFLFEDAAEAVFRLLERDKVRRDLLKPGYVLNINVPNLPIEELKTAIGAEVSGTNYETHCVEAKDPRGRPYYWFAGGRLEDSKADTDIALAEQGYITLSYLRPSFFVGNLTKDLGPISLEAY